MLGKPGELSAEEWALIREHPGAGARLLRRIGLDALADAVAHHHERFDGTGYPAALSGREIPLAARVVAVASAFQASAERPAVSRRAERRRRSGGDAPLRRHRSSIPTWWPPWSRLCRARHPDDPRSRGRHVSPATTRR